MNKNNESVGSVTGWIKALEDKDPDAQQKIWERFVERLVNFSNFQLKGVTVVADGDDVANAAFENFFRKSPEQFERLVDRNDLWQVLAMLAKRRAIDQIRSEIRDRKNTTDGPEFDNLPSSQIPPDFDVLLSEEFERRLGELDDVKLRQIAIDRMQGYRNREIAERMKIGLRSVERKLGEIRSIFATAANGDESE